MVSGRDLPDSLDGAALMGIGDRLVELGETIERHEPVKRETPLTVEVDVAHTSSYDGVGNASS